METRLDALLLKFPGTNCDEETDRALRAAGFATEIQPISLASRERLMKADLLVLSGGFSYGDYIMAAKIAQLEIQRRSASTTKRSMAAFLRSLPRRLPRRRVEEVHLLRGRVERRFPAAREQIVADHEPRAVRARICVGHM